VPEIVFFHGLESGPNGTKARFLKAHFDAVVPGLPTGDFPACLELARQVLKESPPVVLVGSSYGGAIAQVMLGEGRWTGKTILIAPAGEKLGVDFGSPEGEILILHGEYDEVIPLEDSRRYAERVGGRLVVVEGGDHRLNTELERIERVIREALGGKAMCEGE
jgi:pimeloyl-ACP methyl ester carboxylesterase